MAKWTLFVSKFVLWVLVGALAVACLVVVISPATQGLQHAVSAQPLALPELQPLSQRTSVYDAAGTRITQLYSEQDRLLVDLKDIPEKLIAVILATEDRDFYNHRGINYKGIVRAFLNDVKGGKRQGGSTITQQLVKNTMFENGRGNNARDKVKEAILALRLEGQLSKSEILSRYLNTIYFGKGAYGVRTAAERYFDKPLKVLNIPEMALLAGLIASPDSKNPIEHPQAARDRRAEVLTSLVAVGLITTFDAARYNEAPLPTVVHIHAEYRPRTYFEHALQEWLVNGNNPAAQSLGVDARQRELRLYHGGLQIYTTWDRTLDAKLAAAVANAKLPSPVTAAITVIDNHTGAVKAMYEGGRTYLDSPFDLALQSTFQPGSQFKTFTLTAALEGGYSPLDTINGGTCSFDPPVSPAHWAPSTDASGSMTLRHALAKSVNCAFARLEFSLGHGQIGPKKVVEMAQRLGVHHTLDPQGPITLGTSAVSTLDMATAFSVLPNDGIRRPAIYATKILDSSGSVLFDASRETGTQVLNTEVARTMVDIMQDVITSGTATRAKLANGRAAAGKTGTTNNDVSLWFTGYTHELTTSVWVGIPDCQRTLDPACSLQRYFSGSVSVQGGRVPAPIWKTFMDSALEGTPNTDFVPPDASLWPRSVYVTENGRPISAPHIYIPPSSTTTTPTPNPSTKVSPGKGHGATTTPTTKKP